MPLAVMPLGHRLIYLKIRRGVRGEEAKWRVIVEGFTFVPPRQFIRTSGGLKIDCRFELTLGGLGTSWRIPEVS